MKCILLCAGYATRLFPLTENFPKALLEIEDGKPLLDYIISEVNTIDEVDEVFIITNNRYFDHFNNWAASKTDGKPIKVLNDHTMSNDDRLGAIGDINYTIEKENINEDLMIIAGDNLFDYSLRGVVDYFLDKSNPVVCAKIMEDKEQLKSMAVAKVSESKQIIDLVEKPKNPESDIAVYATYMYPKNVLPTIKEYLENGNNPDAPGYLLEYIYKKFPTYVYTFEGNCYDVGTFKSLDEVRAKYKAK